MLTSTSTNGERREPKRLFARRTWGFSCWFVSTRFAIVIFSTTRCRARFTLATRGVFLTVCRCGFAFFRLLFRTLCLHASFGFFKLLTRMFYVLLVQLTARVAVKVDTGRTRLDTVQVTPARGIKAQG
ncbi:MAG: hypothetical protein E6Y11_06125, partial [Corynebacterium sp.]|nr:hypothetical protein [Corynebacterium sp.]